MTHPTTDFSLSAHTAEQEKSWNSLVSEVSLVRFFIQMSPAKLQLYVGLMSEVEFSHDIGGVIQHLEWVGIRSFEAKKV